MENNFNQKNIFGRNSIIQNFTRERKQGFLIGVISTIICGVVINFISKNLGL